MPVTTPKLTILQPHNNDSVNLNQAISGNRTSNQRVRCHASEPVMIDSVTVRVDGGQVIEASLTVVPDKAQRKVNFAASAQVTGGEDPHKLTVTATNDQGTSTTQTVSLLAGPAVVPASYTVHHGYFGSLETVTVHQKNQTGE